MTATLIDISTLALIGNMNAPPIFSLEKMRDGNTATGGYIYPGVGYAGVTLATPSQIDSAQIDSFASGYDGSGGAFEITLTLYAKAGDAPSSDTDGTSLGTMTFTDPNAVVTKTIESSDKTTAFDHVWWRIATGNSSSAASEMRFYDTGVFIIGNSLIRHYASEPGIIVPFSVWATKPAEYDITDCYPGEDWQKGFRLNDQYRTVKPIVGYTAKMQIRDKVGGAVYCELTTENGRISIMGDWISLKLSDGDTEALTFKEGVYDLFLTGGGVTNFVVGGKWIPRKVK